MFRVFFHSILLLLSEMLPLFYLTNACSVFSSFIAQHAEASGRIAGLAAAAEDGNEEEVDEFERLRRISEQESED